MLLFVILYFLLTQAPGIAASKKLVELKEIEDKHYQDFRLRRKTHTGYVGSQRISL